MKTQNSHPLILSNRTTNELLSGDVVIAQSFFERLVGLMGQKSLEAGRVMWIHRCNWIHSAFMKFSLDLIFVNQDMRVECVVHDFKPWRIGLPVWAADSVFEFQAGALQAKTINKGDQLHVGD